MGLMDAWDNLRYNFDGVMDGLRELGDDFVTLVSDSAKEGTELFTVGFHEMVIKDNSDWQTSYENRDEAKQLVDNIDELCPEIKDQLDAVREEVFKQLTTLEETRNVCSDYLWDMRHSIYGLFTDPENIEFHQIKLRGYEYITPAIENIANIKKKLFQVEESDEAKESIPLHGPMPWLQDALKRNQSSQEFLQKVREKVSDQGMIRVMLEEEVACLKQLVEPANRAQTLFESMEKCLAMCVSFIESVQEEEQEKSEIPEAITATLEKAYDYASQGAKIMRIPFLSKEGTQVNRAFQDLLRTLSVPMEQAGDDIVASIKGVLPDLAPISREDAGEKRHLKSIQQIMGATIDPLELVKNALNQTDKEG